MGASGLRQKPVGQLRGSGTVGWAPACRWLLNSIVIKSSTGYGMGVSGLRQKPVGHARASACPAPTMASASYHDVQYHQRTSPYDPYTPTSPPIRDLPYSPLRRPASDSLAPGLIHEPRRQQRLSWRLVLPTLLVVIITAGTASALLVWILIHNTWTFKESYERGIFDLDEGVKTENDLQSAKLTGLTISSVAVSASIFAFELFLITPAAVECRGLYHANHDGPFCFSNWSRLDECSAREHASHTAPVRANHPNA
jgi:hypothetical protein